MVPFRPVRALMALSLLVAACQIVETQCDKECQDDAWLDSGLSPDSCGFDSNKTCLVSRRVPALSDSEKAALPVVVAVHGYTASTYEWEEFRNYAEDTGKAHAKVRVSLVLLGGHGLSLDAFLSSSWKSWGVPILSEYDSLAKQGYKNISFACASAGCALLMQYISDGAFKARQAPKHIFMIDPFVVPASKALSLVDLVGPVLGNAPDQGNSIEVKHWYTSRPQETLQELYELANLVKNRLEDGFKLPKGTLAKVYKSKQDKFAAPVGALLIYKGMRQSDGSHIEVEMVDSHLHDFTRLQGRNLTGNPSPQQRALQLAVFDEMIARILPQKPGPLP